MVRPEKGLEFMLGNFLTVRNTCDINLTDKTFRGPWRFQSMIDWLLSRGSTLCGEQNLGARGQKKAEGSSISQPSLWVYTQSENLSLGPTSYSQLHSAELLIRSKMSHELQPLYILSSKMVEGSRQVLLSLWWQGGRWIVTLRSFFFSQLLKHMDCFTLWACSVNKWVWMCWGISLVS